MTTINNKVIADAIRKEYEDATAVLQLGLNTNRSLAGKGAGDTVQFVEWNNLSEGLEEFTELGHSLTPEGLTQSTFSVIVDHMGKAVEIYDEQVKYAVGGGQAEDMAVAMLSETFTRYVDKKAIEVLGASETTVDGTAGLTGDIFLNAMLENYGENAIENTQAIVVAPKVAAQLLGDSANFVKASAEGYKATYRFEIGRLFNTIPVIMSNRVEKTAEEQYKNLVIPKNALIYALAEDVVVEKDRDITAKSTIFAADSFFAIAKAPRKEAIVVLGK